MRLRPRIRRGAAPDDLGTAAEPRPNREVVSLIPRVIPKPRLLILCRGNVTLGSAHVMVLYGHIAGCSGSRGEY